MAYIETPRTDAGNATLMTNGHNLENFSIENSLLSPLKRKDTRDEILFQMRNGHGSLKTPRARIPLADRRNLPSVPARQEFTPLLQSVTKKNFERKSRLSGQPETPAFLKGSLQHSDSPALPGAEASALYGSELGSSVIEDSNGTPMPHVANSSAQSTPLAVLPKRDATGVLNDQGNLMTLREQENIINKIEKENFGLKLKIHFLEESLRKSGPGFNEAALRENTDLKVDRITLQKELSRCKKMLSQAERDVEALRRHIEEVQGRAKHKQEDEKLQRELETLRQTLIERETEVEEMRVQVETAESHPDEVQKLKTDIEDLQGDLREKDQLIDERDDEIDNIKAQAKKDADELDEAEAELDEAKKRIAGLENDGGKIEETQAELREALEGKKQAEADLDELRDEMSNKSINTKGLSRQLEDKANRLQDDLTDLREKHAQLQTNFDDKIREVERLEEDLQDCEQDADVRDQRLKDQNELLCSERESIAHKCQSLNDQMQQAVKDLQSKSEEKDLLHSRHDALISESQQLQKELSKAHLLVAEFDQSLKDEKQHAEDNDRQLRSEAKNEVNRLSEEINDLHRELEDKVRQAAADKDLWESQRRNLESQKEKAEEQASGLQRTISKLHETEGTLSGREAQLQEALDSEKQRHESEEAVLQRQVQDLNAEVEEKRQALDDLRSGLSESREDLRISQRDQADLEEKVQALEDEIEVLQTGLDEESEKAKEEMNAVHQEAESLRSQLDAAKERLIHAQDDNAHDDRSELELRLRNADGNLRDVRGEKQSLQDRLATSSLELHKLQSSIAEVEAERDELQSQLKHMQGQVDETFRLGQEKLELRSSKLKLENEAIRLRREQQSLAERNDSLERGIEAEISKADAEKTRLRDEVADLGRKLSLASRGQNRELSAAKQKTQRLEARISELESHLAKDNNVCDNAAELSILQKDLSAARKKETDLLQREAAQKDLVRDLKQRVARLERQLHEAELARASIDSPKSSISGSAHKTELIDLRRQLSDVQQQLREARTKSKDDRKSLQQRLHALERQNQDAINTRDRLEADLSLAQHEQASLQTAGIDSTATITRLRTRISSLETDLRNHYRGALADSTIAEERKDLHDLLKDSKLQAEDLQLQIASREKSIAAAATRERDLRAQLTRVREERSLQAERSDGLAVELENLQMRYERTLENLSRQQRLGESERKAVASRVRFSNASISELNSSEKELEKRHIAELRGLAKQIQWLRAKLHREGAFREGLIYEKKWLLMRIGMFEACNATDLQLLSEIGVNPRTNLAAATRLRLGDALRGNARGLGEKRKSSLRTIAFAIIAGVRMRKMASDWAVQRRAKEALGRKLEGIGKPRASYVH